MSLVTENTGKAIRTFRKKNKLTVQELADRICKSKATVSKYESGKISLDLDTLFDIAQVLQVRLEQLLYMPPENVPTETVTVPNFFKNLNHMYIYMYDGRNNHLNRTIINVFPENQHIFPAIMYMNIKNYNEYLYRKIYYPHPRVVFRCSHQMGHGIRRFFPTINARRYQNAYFKKNSPGNRRPHQISDDFQRGYPPHEAIQHAIFRISKKTGLWNKILHKPFF